MTCTCLIDLCLHPGALCYDASQVSQGLCYHPLPAPLGAKAYRSLGGIMSSQSCPSRAL